MSQIAKLISAALIALIAGSACAEEALTPIPKISNEWAFSVTPYVWAPGITSTLSYNDRYLKTADVSANNIISNLKTGGMIAGEARYGNWGIFADFVSATLQNTGAPTFTPQPGYHIHAADKVTMQQTILSAAATYNLFNDKNSNVDALLGVRWISMTSTLNFAIDGTPLAISDAKSMSTADPIVGLKGRYRIANSTWYIPYYADIGSGGGTTNVTWQAMLGVGKTIEKWVDVSLSYRSLYYDMSGSKSNGLLQKTTFQGPQLAVTFNF